ncbi:flagellar biosynthetic protein FliR [Paenibacillus thalictri]|uniref:Flagellar biosynthetic protein FliR n=1 Tax=Paenibacillus thalictri TaxID=2527873 RepID=A0A4Q9DQT2_9BACL|nr:flagellar biosynthetic protein FliR [Paenibacillus thalictri]TBL77742.1 flagellar type III secretion system protein FliR [Paenibacillus thalictri]
MEFISLYLPAFLLVFCRISAFFVVAPVFSSRNVPGTFKIGFTFFVALIAFTTVGFSSPVSFDTLYLLSIIRELLVGICLGFVSYLFFTVVQIAGSFVDIQMGFAIANVIDPMTGASSPVLGNLKYMLAMLLFLVFNGHHLLLKGIMESYTWIPLSNDLFAHMYSGELSDFMLKTFSTVFALSLQMAAPLVVAFFLTDVGLGLLARVAPQFNIFVLGMPLKILLGFILLILLFPGFIYIYEDLFTSMFQSMQKLIDLMGK